MTINSTYNIGDIIWFYDNIERKYFKAIISDIHSWNKNGGITYVITYEKSEGNQDQNIIRENDIYQSKEEILNSIFNDYNSNMSDEALDNLIVN